MTKNSDHANNCIFCKIIKGEIPSSKFFEDTDFIAILDLFPNTKGQTIIIPKKHITSNIFNADFKIVHLGLDTCNKVAKILTKQLHPSRIALVTEGVFVDHLHFKLYPIYNEEKYLNTHETDEPIFFKSFPGYITTKGGPEASREELDLLAGVLGGE